MVSRAIRSAVSLWAQFDTTTQLPRLRGAEEKGGERRRVSKTSYEDAPSRYLSCRFCLCFEEKVDRCNAEPSRPPTVRPAAEWVGQPSTGLENP